MSLVRSPEAEAGELVLANNRVRHTKSDETWVMECHMHHLQVGGLRLQHHLADRESPGHLKAL